VPLNLFGGAGSITREMLDYVTFNAHDNVGYELRNYTGNLSGEIFDLPAGPLGLAIGYEWRQESGFDDPDAFIASGNTTGNARKPTRGRYSTKEAFIELAVPILAGAPMAEALELQVAARRSDYSSFGATTNLKFGIRWQPITDLLVRGTYAEGFRAPSIGELFFGQSDSFPNLNDPCSRSVQNGGNGITGGLDLTPDTENADDDPTTPETPRTSAATIELLSQRLANCINQPVNSTAGTFTPEINGPFVPNTGSYGQASTQIRITVGGNPALDPETAESTTFGVVYSPSYVDGLSLTLDWFKIELKQAIGGLAVSQVTAGCYDDGNQERCNSIERLPTGQIDDLQNLLFNLNKVSTEGIDLNVVYRAGQLPFLPGDWKFTWDTAYVDEYDQCDETGCQAIVRNNLGNSSIPAFKSNLEVEWDWGDWEAAWRARFLGSQWEECTTTNAPHICSDGDRNHLGATTYHNVQVSYSLSEWDTRFTFGVQNIGDKSPPLSQRAFANSFDPTTYEIPGRFPYFRVTKTF
jgi:outer membrane receptor protein involved in Fe transport